MRRLVLIQFLALVCGLSPRALATMDDLMEEGKRLHKRFVGTDTEFEGHDIAFISHDYGEGRFRRSAKTDLDGLRGEGEKNIQLDLLSSGKSLKLALRHTPVAGPDTEVFYNTRDGLVKRSGGNIDDCYASGSVDGAGVAAVSFCDGLFGLASSGGYDYFLQPATDDSDTSTRFTRDVTAHHKVHVLWRRSEPDSSFLRHASLEDALERKEEEEEEDDDEDENEHDYIELSKRAASNQGKQLVLELALFSDAAYWKKLQANYPGREDDFQLTRVAATQALYSDREKVGYDFFIKVKYIEYWIEDPKEYDFQQSLSNNLNSFCVYTKDRYFYDMHGLNTGITEQPGNAVGLAYLRRACQNRRCFDTYLVGPNSFGVYAHEIGHNLGFNHPSVAKCPENLQRAGSFMGSTMNFSECNKWELEDFIASGQADCLLEETRKSKTPKKYQNLPSAYPGQWKTPDELCELYSGPGFVYYPPGPTEGSNVCNRWICLNNDKSSGAYGKIETKAAPAGFPCGNEMFCKNSMECIPLDTPTIGWDVDELRASEGVSQWTKWTSRWTSCSRQCGTGVQIRTRNCKKNGINLKPFCEGPAYKAKLCNTQSCNQNETLQTIADDVCRTFLENDVQMVDGEAYLPKATILDDTLKRPMTGLTSKSCLVSCKRKSEENAYPLDAILPDGAPCSDTERTPTELSLFGIQLRCVRGVCMEFSNCPPDILKDACGICNGDGSRCVTKVIDSSSDVAQGERSVFAVIPAGSRNINVAMRWSKNRGNFLELWSKTDEQIIGLQGRFVEDVYDLENTVKYAGVQWTYARKIAYLRTPGPIRQDVVIKARRGKNPITEATIRYAKPE